MTYDDINYMRFANQQLSSTKFKTPAEIVSYLGAVQSQDYVGAKWALALRLPKPITDKEIENEFTKGAIIRTHVMRPTWHFVSPNDVTWMQALTAPRVHTMMSSYNRKLELDQKLFSKADALLVNALKEKRELTRQELRGVLQKEGIAKEKKDNVQRLAHIVMHAELEGLLCSGARHGKQFTYALISERAPNTQKLNKKEALKNLSLRYFTSHGPATIKDFRWWSGLKASDANEGLELVKSNLVSEVVDGKTYWFAKGSTIPKQKSPAAYLLSNYDEYIIGYADHTSVFDPSYGKKFNLLFAHSIVINGQVVGGWRREFKKNSLHIKLQPYRKLTSSEYDAISKQAKRYEKFLAVPVTLSPHR